MLRLLNALFLLACMASPGLADPLGLGRVADADEIAAWDIDIRPDGLGLPVGQGDVALGEELFNDVCAACHGDFGEGLGLYPSLAGGEDTLTQPRPVKSIGSFVPYLSTIFDFIHRAKPFGDAQSYSTDEEYALVAYLLYLNDLVDEDFILSQGNFPDIHLPNEAAFFSDDRTVTELPVFSADPCMADCKSSVEIVSRGLADITPEGAEN
ncbi:MAG: cytochrome c [Paracoccaceae bacterium]